MCSSPPICKLTPYSSSRKLDRPAEADPDRLSLALEPEAAGLFCQNSRDSEHRNKPQNFTVLDIGGGTVDITSYHIDQDGNFHVVDKASGNDWGGTRVNEMFTTQFLETVVDDPSFKQYLSVSDTQIQQKHKADLNKLIYGEFEQEKVSFGDEEDDDKRVPAVINIPSSFLRFYKEKLQAAIKSHYSGVAELDDHELSIEPHKMKQFFQPAIENICKSASEALERVKTKDPANETQAVYLFSIGTKISSYQLRTNWQLHVELLCFVKNLRSSGPVRLRLLMETLSVLYLFQAFMTLLIRLSMRKE